MKKIIFHVAADRVDKHLLGEIIDAILNGNEDNEELKLKVFKAITQQGENDFLIGQLLLQIKNNRLIYGPVPTITHAGINKSGVISPGHSVCLMDVPKHMILRTDAQDLFQ